MQKSTRFLTTRPESHTGKFFVRKMTWTNPSADRADFVTPSLLVALSDPSVPCYCRALPLYSMTFACCFRMVYQRVGEYPMSVGDQSITQETYARGTATKSKRRVEEKKNASFESKSSNKIWIAMLFGRDLTRIHR